MAGVMIEEFEPFHDPRIEPGRHVARDLENDVPPILEPAKLRLRRRGPHRLFTFLAMISVVHPARYARPRRNAFVRDPATGAATRFARSRTSPHVAVQARSIRSEREAYSLIFALRNNWNGSDDRAFTDWSDPARTGTYGY